MALHPLVLTTDKGIAGGIAPLGSDSLVPPANLPPVSPTSQQGQGTYLESGGGFTYTGLLNFRVSAGVAVFQFNKINFIATNVTLSAADSTNPRQDSIVVDNTGTVSVVTGIPAVNPATPDTDPITQIVLATIFVPATATSLVITTTNVYKENTEWSTSISGTGINANSTNSPFAGSKDVEFTNVAANAYIRFTAPSAISLANVKQLVFQFRSKGAFANAKSILITWYDASGVKVGQSVGFFNNAFGVNLTQTTTYQQIIIPLTQFSINLIKTVKILEFKVNGSGASIPGGYFDNITLENDATTVTDNTPNIIKRGVLTVTTASIADGTVEEGSIAITKTALIQKIQSNISSWVRFYPTQADLVTDRSRSVNVDPDATINIHGEISFLAGGYYRRPMWVYNDDLTTTNLIYYSIMNRSGSTQAVQIDIQYLPVEFQL